MEQSALTGIKVLEYSEMVSGPYCAKLLADLGAEVIKIEKPDCGDKARQRGPFLNGISHPERSGLFLYLNTNKHSVTLDPAKKEGKLLFLELVRWADVLIEDTTPGTMKSLGIGYDVLCETNPSIIVTSITPFGQTGPYSEYKAHHLNIYHASGQASFSYTEKPGGNKPPVKGGGFVGDYDAGLSGAVATMAALYNSAPGGVGQHIDVSKQENLISLDRVDISNYANDPDAQARRRGMLGGMMPCKDGYVMVVAPQQHQWEGLVKLLGDPEWAHSDKCSDEQTRSENHAELQPLIEEWMLQHNKQEIYHLGQSFSCPVAPINSAADVYNSPQEKHREFFTEAEHPEAGKLSYPGGPYKFSETPWQLNKTAPLLGEDNDDVFREQLGHSEEELNQMKKQGAI